MLIDCGSCELRDVACGDCVVTVLLGPVELDDAQRAAVAVLADSGLVPPLRLAPRPPGPPSSEGDGDSSDRRHHAV